MIEPTISLAEALRHVGYSEATALHHASEIVNTPGVQAALENAKGRYKSALAKRITPEDAAARKVGLAMQNEQPGTALAALDGVLEDSGMREPKDKRQMMMLVIESLQERMLPLIFEFIPVDRLPEFRRRIRLLLPPSELEIVQPEPVQTNQKR